MPDTIPVGKYYNFDNKNVDVVYNPAKDEGKGSSGGGTVFVDCTYDEENNAHIATKTAGEIFNLITDGNTVVFREKIDVKTRLLPCLGAVDIDVPGPYVFYVCPNKQIGVFSAGTASDYPTMIEEK